jgi:3',5'-cyclic AMP phosphodiesterase CpdA
MFRIAHVSDCHVAARWGAHWRAILFNKRLTGYLNLRLGRARAFRPQYLGVVLDAASRAADHVVVTGDITNLALESEYAAARALLDDVTHSVEVTVVPGNHDIYLPTTLREELFSRYFGEFLRSDFPDLAVDLPVGRYPCVKVRGPVAVIGLSSAVPRPPFVAAGYVGKAQLTALSRALEHPEIAGRTPIILIHHPPVDGRTRFTQLRDGLVDVAPLRAALQPVERGLVLFGHLHTRVRCVLPTRDGSLDVISASGASLDSPDPAVRAGFNLYEIEDDGTIVGIEAHVIDASGQACQRMTIPSKPECT